MRIEITPAARADISDILIYSERTWGPKQRSIYRHEIDATLRRLSMMPEMGRQHPELSPRLRSVRMESHHLYYWVDEDRLTIARILHHRQNPRTVDWESLQEELDGAS